MLALSLGMGNNIVCGSARAQKSYSSQRAVRLM